jgi:hypothetical protein
LRVDRLQQRALDEKRLAVQLAPRPLGVEGVAYVEDAQLEELARVVPLVECVSDVEPFIALEANQIGAERRGGGNGERRLADAVSGEVPGTMKWRRRGRPHSAGRRAVAGDRRWIREVWR